MKDEMNDTVPSPERISDADLFVVMQKQLHDALWKFVLILPKCDVCSKIAVRRAKRIGSDSYGYSCDEHDHINHLPDWTSCDLPYSEAVRKLYIVIENAGFESIENAMSLKFSKGK